MDVTEARGVLGVDGAASANDVRAAYRQLLRTHHPDVSPDPHGAHRTMQLTAAYAALTHAPASVPAPPSARVVCEEESLWVEAPNDEAFFRVLEAAHTIGDVTYVDTQAGLVEAVLTLADHHGRDVDETDADETVCSVLLSLQGRGHGTEVFVTVEALTKVASLPSSAVVQLLAAHMYT